MHIRLPSISLIQDMEKRQFDSTNTPRLGATNNASPIVPVFRHKSASKGASFFQRPALNRSYHMLSPLSIQHDKNQVHCKEFAQKFVEWSSEASTGSDSEEQIQLNPSTHKNNEAVGNVFVTESSMQGTLIKRYTRKVIPLGELIKNFHSSMIEVGAKYGVCTAAVKRACRRYGITKWPQRQIIKAVKTVDSLEVAIKNVPESEKDHYRQQILEQKRQFLKLMRSPVGHENNIEVQFDVYAGIIRDKLGMKDDNLKLLGSVSDSILASPKQSRTKSSEKSNGRWTLEEHTAFLRGMQLHGRNWIRVAEAIGTRDATQTRSHAQKYLLRTRNYSGDDLDMSATQPSSPESPSSTISSPSSPPSSNFLAISTLLS